MAQKPLRMNMNMNHRDSLTASRGKRSFGIKLKKKPHKRWPESLHLLRVRFKSVDINDVDLDQLNLFGSSSNPLHPRRRRLDSSENPFDDDVADVKKDVEGTEKDEEDDAAIDTYRRGHIICDFETTNLEIDVLMPNLSSVTILVDGLKKLKDIKPEIILQARRYPDSDDICETTRYVFWFYDRKGVKREVYDEERTIGSLDLMVPILNLREPDGHNIETEQNEYIADSVGMSLTTIEAVLDCECTRFRSILFDSIQEAEKQRQHNGLDHYAFPEETVLQGFQTSMKPAESVEMFEGDLDKLKLQENGGEESEERAMERLKRKIEASAGVAQIWYRPNETDDYTFFAQIGRDVIERTPVEVIEMALDYLKGREGVEIREPPEDFILQVAGKESFITRHLPLKRYEYIRSSFENYKTPVLILRLKKTILPNYPAPPRIFVPAFMQAERKIKEERDTIESDRVLRKAKETESIHKIHQKVVPKAPPSTVVLDIEDIPQSEPINFWDIDDDLKIRIQSASHLIVTGIEKLYVKVAICVGSNVITQRDTPIVQPSNPRWGNCMLDFALYLKDIPKSAHLSFSLISEKARKKQAPEAVPLGFVNIRLFDWDDFLIQGKKTVFFWPYPKDLKATLNPTGIAGTSHDQTIARLEVELMEFGNAVKYPPFTSVMQYVKIMRQRRARMRTNEDELPAIDDFSEGSENVKKLMNLRQTMVPKSLKIEEQRFLWQARRKISSNFPSMLPIIVDIPMVWKTREMFCEMYGMLMEWPLLQVDAAMEMLDGKYTDVWIRDAAVDRIDRALGNDQLQLYLLPLVQALRYEPFANSGLSKMLIKRGLLNYKIGHTLFWLLRAELNYFELNYPIVKLPKFHARFSICLEMYLRGNAIHLPGIVKQVKLVNILTELSLVVKTVGVKESATKKLQQELTDQHDALQNMISPLNPCDRLGDLLINRCSVLGSAKQPLLLTWKNPQPLSKLTSDTHQILFKNGDDLRQDMLTLQVMRIMDAKWKLHNLDFCLTLYEVLPMGKNIGMIHVVQNCQTLFQIQTASNQVGPSLTMDNSLLNRYLYQCSSDSKQYMECVDRFASSVAGYCIATYVLGIKDRHQDNIMLARDGRLFHIDFGHFLGHTKKKLGINRERTEFILTEHFLNIISRGKSNFKDTYDYKSFRDSCIRGFMVLFHNSRFFIILFRMMLCMGLPELSAQSNIEFLFQSLMYESMSDQARKDFSHIFDSVVKSDFATSVNWFFHSVKHL